MHIFLEACTKKGTLNQGLKCKKEYCYILKYMQSIVSLGLLQKNHNLFYKSFRNAWKAISDEKMEKCFYLCQSLTFYLKSMIKCSLYFSWDCYLNTIMSQFCGLLPQDFELLKLNFDIIHQNNEIIPFQEGKQLLCDGESIF